MVRKGNEAIVFVERTRLLVLCVHYHGAGRNVLALAETSPQGVEKEKLTQPDAAVALVSRQAADERRRERVVAPEPAFKFLRKVARRYTE
jgi:hypothetical protein